MNPPVDAAETDENPQPDTIVVSSRLLTGKADDLEEVSGLLGFSAGRIARVERLEPDEVRIAVERYKQAGAVIHDFGARLVTPAFVDAHTHLNLCFLRAFDAPGARAGNMVEDLFFRMESNLTPADVRAFVRMGAYEALLSGTGLVWDHYYEALEVAAALDEVGLAGVIAPTLQDLAGPGKEDHDVQLARSEEIARSGHWAERGVFAALGPHATDTVSPGLLRRALELTERERLPLHMHVAQSIDEVRRLKAREGLTPAEWLSREVADRDVSLLLAHALFAAQDDLRRLAAGSATLVFCPSSQLEFGFPARVGWWEEAGIDWVVATDCSASNDTFDVRSELRQVSGQRTVGTVWEPDYARFFESGDLAAAEQVWARRSSLFGQHRTIAEPTQLLKRVWSAPGALHPAFTAGALEVGALANVVVWDLGHPNLWPASDPLASLCLSAASPAIHGMFVMGKPRGEAGDFQRSLVESDEYRACRVEASRRLEELRGRAGLSSSD